MRLTLGKQDQIVCQGREVRYADVVPLGLHRHCHIVTLRLELVSKVLAKSPLWAADMSALRCFTEDLGGQTT